VALLLLFFVTGFFDHWVHGQCIIVLLDAEGDGVALCWNDTRGASRAHDDAVDAVV